MRGRLLVAMPAIDNGPFWRSVVYLLDHDDDGALGVIVNHPMESDVDDVLPGWASLANAPVCLFDGGPVAMDSALALGVVDQARIPAGFKQMAGRVGLIDLDGPVPLEGELLGLRVFAGYAGWSPGQLEDEVAEGSWIVVDSYESDVFSPRPDTLWREVLLRQDGDVRYLATYPADPAAN